MPAEHHSIERLRLLASAICGGIVLSASIPAPPVYAQSNDTRTPAESEDDTIVILGKSSKQRDRAITAFVKGLTVMSQGDPTARFEPDIYCPAVFGMSDARNREIADRMRTVAAAAGIKPAPPGCVASAFVFFVEDKKRFLKAFAKQQPIFFYGMTGEPHEEAGPAVAWSLTQDFDPQRKPLGYRIASPPIVSSVAGGSRLLSMITRAVAASVVVVERRALFGLTARQVADYAVMRSIIDRTPSGFDTIKPISILGVLDAPVGSSTPLSLTTWDLGYLKGRYTGDPRTYSYQQSGDIRASIKRDLEKAAP